MNEVIKRMNLDAEFYTLIPPSCRQRITSLGPADLIFLTICTPRFRPEAYEDIDIDNTIQE